MKRISSRWPVLIVLAAIIAAILSLNPASAFGQATTAGTVVGVVTDTSGAAIPGASIVLKDTTTNTTRTVASNGSGQFVFSNVSPGVYTITATKTGFSITQISNQTVAVGTQTTANFKMAVGAETTTVDVQSTGSDLQTLNATVGDEVPPIAIDSMPSIERDVATFATLQPGVAPDGSVAGTVYDQAVFQLDGGNNSNDMDGSMRDYTGAFGGTPTGQNSVGSGASGVMPMPIDSIEEFKVNIVNQTADFNNSSGSQTEVVTKRGTNKWKGTAYEYYLDSNIGANTWQNNFPTNVALEYQYQPKPSYHYNRYGFAAGGPILPNLWGGKTYFFANYEGFSYPNAATFERSVPSPSLLAGNLIENGTTYNLKAIDPRGIGLNPDVLAMWNKYEPAGNDPGCSGISGAYCDTFNEWGFRGNVNLPQKSKFGVARIDHDFGAKWHLMASYRYFDLKKLVTSQVDIGGFFPGDVKGVPTSTASRPQQPWYFVTGLTTNITSNTTNDFHYSYLRNFWSWSTQAAPPQITGLGGALEPFGEQNTKVLAPFNVDSQDIRTRFWDGKDHFFRDDVTILKGNHLIQFGGQYQHNFNYHQRTDNGGGINYTPTYLLGDATGAGSVSFPGLQAAGYPSGTGANRLAAAALGIVTDSQIAYTRTGNSLTLNPPLTPAQDKVVIPYYNVYASDTWHAKPSLTVNFGLGWTLEMPPTEATGKQVALVDSSDEPVVTADYLAQRKAAANQGAVYNPEIGFALVGNVGAGYKYPFNPFYGSFSPRLSAAWNPHFDSGSLMGKVFGENATVIRGGYGRVFGRLNGVGLVLVPLLGAGLIQPVSCKKALATGACGPANPTDTTGFRVGTDGNTAPLGTASATLPQPLYPGYNNISSATGEVIDPHFRPNQVDSFNLTIQRQVTRKTLVEAGYIGRIIRHEYQPININTVPYMMVQGGQTFAAAYAAIETAAGCTVSAGKCILTAANATGPAAVYPTVSAQPFFEASLAGTGYCNHDSNGNVYQYANCTTAVTQKEIVNLTQQAVWNLWSDLDNGGFNFPRSMTNTPIPSSVSSYGSNGAISQGVSLNTAAGYSNYNAGFVSVKVNDWHGITAQENFTYSKTLGTGAVSQADGSYTPNDAFDLSKTYGVQPFNRKFVFNTFVVYQIPWFKEQHGIEGRLLGGWNIAPIFTAGSDAPLYCNTNTDAQSFGGGDGQGFADNEQCVFTSKYGGGNHTYRNINGGTDPYGNPVGTGTLGPGPAAVNMFANPVAVWNQVRAPILGIDTKNPGVGPISGLPYWNMDVSIRKNFVVYEGYTVELSGIITNVLNHLDFADPYMAIDQNDSANWGVVNSQGNAPRQIQVGARVNF
jgi:hypothetical protein